MSSLDLKYMKRGINSHTSVDLNGIVSCDRATPSNQNNNTIWISLYGYNEKIRLFNVPLSKHTQLIMIHPWIIAGNIQNTHFHVGFDFNASNIHLNIQMGSRDDFRLWRSACLLSMIVRNALAKFTGLFYVPTFWMKWAKEEDGIFKGDYDTFNLLCTRFYEPVTRLVVGDGQRFRGYMKI